ncbi:MAG: hypothetical protein J3Q66DRAFT_438574 [Benniella sp.]|nr:MAG: hypothetical protein J3Q66DRAFT_438574 [Benniella sp.]
MTYHHLTSNHPQDGSNPPPSESPSAMEIPPCKDPVHCLLNLSTPLCASHLYGVTGDTVVLNQASDQAQQYRPGQDDKSAHYGQRPYYTALQHANLYQFPQPSLPSEQPFPDPTFQSLAPRLHPPPVLNRQPQVYLSQWQAVDQQQPTPFPLLEHQWHSEEAQQSQFHHQQRIQNVQPFSPTNLPPLHLQPLPQLQSTPVQHVQVTQPCIGHFSLSETGQGPLHVRNHLMLQGVQGTRPQLAYTSSISHKAQPNREQSLQIHGSSASSQGCAASSPSGMNHANSGGAKEPKFENGIKTCSTSGHAKSKRAPTRLTGQQKHAIRLLRAGTRQPSFQTIAKEIGCSKSTVWRHAQKKGAEKAASAPKEGVLK